MTRLAWTFLVLAALGVAAALLPLVIFGILLPAQELQILTQQMEEILPTGRGPIAWVIAHLQLMLGATLIMSLATLHAALGLLRRSEWARRLVMALLMLGAGVHVAGAVFTLVLPLPVPAGIPEDMREAAAALRTLLTGALVALGIVFGALFAWAAQRLRRPEIRREFLP